MSFFDWWKRKTAAVPGDVRDLLLAAFRAHNDDEFLRLLNENAATIPGNFKGWTTVPEGIRNDPGAVNEYVQMLVAVAQAFQSVGHSELLAHLTRGGKENPITRWQEALAEAQLLHAASRYPESNTLLFKILEEVQGSTGSAVDSLRPRVYGTLGTNFFRLNDLGQATRYTQLALQDCVRTGDQEGVATYGANLRSLEGSDLRDPRALVRKAIAEAQNLSDSLLYEESNAVLLRTLGSTDGEAPAREYRPKIEGLLGSNYFRLGDTRLAREYTQRALEGCERANDQDGVRIYRENLRVITAQPSGK